MKHSLLLIQNHAEIILRNIRSLINDNKCYGAVIVSHDLNFLNDSTNKVFKLRNGTIE